MTSLTQTNNDGNLQHGLQRLLGRIPSYRSFGLVSFFRFIYICLLQLGRSAWSRAGADAHLLPRSRAPSANYCLRCQGKDGFVTGWCPTEVNENKRSDTAKLQRWKYLFNWGTRLGKVIYKCVLIDCLISLYHKMTMFFFRLIKATVLPLFCRLCTKF